MAYGEGGAWLGCKVTDDPDIISRCQDQVRLAAQFAVPLAPFVPQQTS